ncbi:MAG: hypothetical protein WAL83_12860 [Arenicellales bacterium]
MKRHGLAPVEPKINNREGVPRPLARGEIDLVIIVRAPDDIDCVAAPFATR